MKSGKKTKGVKNNFRFTAATILECLLYAKTVILRGGYNYDHHPHSKDVSGAYALNLYNRLPFNKNSVTS